jgi:hypothetical protein
MSAESGANRPAADEPVRFVAVITAGSTGVVDVEPGGPNNPFLHHPGLEEVRAAAIDPASTRLLTVWTSEQHFQVSEAPFLDWLAGNRFTAPSVVFKGLSRPPLTRPDPAASGKGMLAWLKRPSNLWLLFVHLVALLGGLDALRNHYEYSLAPPSVIHLTPGDVYHCTVGQNLTGLPFELRNVSRSTRCYVQVDGIEIADAQSGRPASGVRTAPMSDKDQLIFPAEEPGSTFKVPIAAVATQPGRYHVTVRGRAFGGALRGPQRLEFTQVIQVWKPLAYGPPKFIRFSKLGAAEQLVVVEVPVQIGKRYSALKGTLTVVGGKFQLHHVSTPLGQGSFSKNFNPGSGPGRGAATGTWRTLSVEPATSSTMTIYLQCPMVTSEADVQSLLRDTGQFQLRVTGED